MTLAAVITRGDGSERCLVCGLRHRRWSWYVALAERGKPWPTSPGWPACSWEHAQVILVTEEKATPNSWSQMPLTLDK